MDTREPNGKSEIKITFGPYDKAAINGKELEGSARKQFNYTLLRITKKEKVNWKKPKYSNYYITFNIEYGWIRPSIFSTLSSDIKYVRCARIELKHTGMRTGQSSSVEFYTEEVVYAEGFYYFIDTSTTCGRTLGSSSDCNKDTESADKNLKNQIMNYKEGYPLTTTAEQRETRIKEQQEQQQRESNETNRIVAERKKQREEVRLAKEAQERIIKEREMAEQLKQKIDDAVNFLKARGYRIFDPINPSPTNPSATNPATNPPTNPSATNTQGGRRTRGRKTRGRKTRSRV